MVAEHPVTLNDRMDLATALQANRQYLAAEAEYRMVIQLQEKVIGPKHAYTLNTRNNLAELLDDEGKFAEAEAECRQIIGLEDKVLGPNHRLTLNSRANLAVAVLGQGRIEEAETANWRRHEVDGRETRPGLSRHGEFYGQICDRFGASRQDRTKPSRLPREPRNALAQPWGRTTRSHRNMPGFCSP